MRVSFIGMSNIGKTYWAKRIAARKGIEHIDCDALIEKQLEPELKQLGFRGLRDVAKWMGQPPDPQYKKNSKNYVTCEQSTMRSILGKLAVDAEKCVVVDTTGSVIYTGTDILTELRMRTRVIYFEASETHIDGLFRRYMKHPKPLIWGDAFAPQKGEEPHQTLKRCYPDLLRERAQHYRDIAHLTIPFGQHRNHAIDIAALIGIQ